MTNYHYLIIGGGMAADSAVRGIRQVDQDNTIGVICKENDPPYNRPPLSKGLWKGEPFESIWRPTFELDAHVLVGRKVVEIDPVKKVVRDDGNDLYRYEKLLLATGGSVRRLSNADESVIYFRTAEDYRRLHKLSETDLDFVVIGGGFIGAEIAAALAMNGKQVTMIFPSEAIGRNVYPRALAENLNAYYREQGVTLLTSESVASVYKAGDGMVVSTGGGKVIHADGVVAGLGISPNTGLAEEIGLLVDNGIVVDEYLRSSNHDIYAAGDVANFFSPALDMRLRVEHEDNANVMGEIAGRNMAGENSLYHHLPFFYSDLFELGYEAVGELDSSMDIIEDWKEPFRKGVVYYLRSGRVHGVLLWNTWGQVEKARELIAEKSTHTRAILLGRISD